MTDDDSELAGLDLGAWEPPPPPGGLADAVVARMREPVQVAARELGERGGGRRKWWMLGAAVAAAAVAGAVMLARWGVTRAPANGRGDVFAARATHLELGPSSAELDLGAELRWQRDGHRIGVAQPRGAATWRVGDKDTLAIDAGAAVASVEATGASLRVEVQMNPTDARVIGASAATAIAAALVTVVVYEGHVKVSGAGQTVNVGPGGTVEVRPGQPPHEVLAVGAQDVEARIRALQDEIAANRKDFEEKLRVLTAKHPDDTTVKDPNIPPEDPVFLRATGKGLMLAEGAVLACENGKFLGKLAASLRVAPSGKVEQVKLDPASTSVTRCVTDALLAVKFPPTKTGGKIDAEYTFGVPALVPPPPRVGCNAREFMQDGDSAYTAGAYDDALAAYENAQWCEPGPKSGQRAFMAACRLRSVAKARRYYQQYPAETAKALQICIGEGIDESSLKKPPACDAADLLAKGVESYAGGAHAAALTQFEQSLACEYDPAAALRAFMAACKTRNVVKARYYYLRDPQLAMQALAICAAEGIVLSQLEVGTKLTAPGPTKAPPAPPAPPRIVAPSLLEGSRIAGDKNIVPDDATKAKIAASGKDKIIGSFKLCIDAAGAVTQVTRLKPTSFDDYDARIEREMKTWRYRPFVDDGKAVAVCTAVTFIYRQSAGSPAPCNADELGRDGADSYAAGSYAAALTMFERALACKVDPTTVARAFMASCKISNVSKARRFYRMNPEAARRALTVCVANGITKDDLEATP